MTTGETIKIERERAGLTQKQLASHLGISQQMLSFVEEGRRFLGTNDLFACAKKLGVSASYLLTGDSDENRKCAAEELGIEDKTITTLKDMCEEELRAIEALINDPIFPMAWSAYLYATDQGLYHNGNKLISENEDVTVGNYGSFGGGYQVGTLISFIREQNIIALLRSIKKEGAKK